MSEYYTQEEINQMLENKVKIEEDGTIPLSSTKVNYTTGATIFQAVPVTVDTPILTSENTIGEETITVKSIVTEVKNIKKMVTNIVNIIHSSSDDNIVEDTQKVRYRIDPITATAEVIGWGYNEAPEDNKPDINITLPNVIEVTEKTNEELNGMYIIVGIGKRAFANLGIKTIVFSDTIEYVDDEAFYCCRDLDSMTLNRSLKKFGYRACAHTESLKTINIEETSIESFGTSAFLGSRIPTIIIPETTKKLGKSVFARCKHATSIDVRSPYITEYPDAIFLGCKEVDSITLIKGNSEQVIGKKAFARVGCTTLSKRRWEGTYPKGSIQNIVFPESVTIIHRNALHSFGARNIQFKSKKLDIRTNGLKGCLAEHIQFDEEAQIILGACSMCYCDNLTEIILPINTTFKLIVGNIYDKERKNYDRQEIGMYFAFCDQLTKITHLGNFNGLNFTNGNDHDRAFWKALYVVATDGTHQKYHPNIQVVVSESFLTQNNLSDGATMYHSGIIWKKST